MCYWWSLLGRLGVFGAGAVPPMQSPVSVFAAVVGTPKHTVSKALVHVTEEKHLNHNPDFNDPNPTLNIVSLLSN